MGLQELFSEAKNDITAAINATVNAVNSAAEPSLSDAFKVAQSAPQQYLYVNLVRQVAEGLVDPSQVTIGSVSAQIREKLQRMKEEREGGSFSRFLQTLDILNQIAELRELNRELAELRADIKKTETELAEKYGDDWQEKVAAEYLEPDVLVRRDGETQEEYEERILGELAQKHKDGEIDDPLLARWIEQKMREKEIVARKREIEQNVNHEIEQRKEQISDIETQLLVLDGLKSELGRIRALPEDERDAAWDDFQTEHEPFLNDLGVENTALPTAEALDEVEANVDELVEEKIVEIETIENGKSAIENANTYQDLADNIPTTAQSLGFDING